MSERDGSELTAEQVRRFWATRLQAFDEAVSSGKVLASEGVICNPAHVRVAVEVLTRWEAALRAELLQHQQSPDRGDITEWCPCRGQDAPAHALPPCSGAEGGA